MTLNSVRLVRLTATDLTDEQGQLPEPVADLRWVLPWSLAPDWLPDREREPLISAAGGQIYPVRKDEIHALLTRPSEPQVEADWQEQLELIENLEPGRYGLVYPDGNSTEEDVQGQPIDRQIYIQPDWPEDPFNLLSKRHRIEIGPFTKDGWSVGPDGTLWDAPGGGRPVTLRVRRQKGRLIFANDGDMGAVTYRIAPLSRYRDDAQR